MLTVTNLSKSYGRFPALDQVSFSVQEGEIFGLLGPNGAGKTTLLSILAALSKPASGKVTLLGHELDRDDIKIRKWIGIGTQELSIYQDLSARENLRFFGKLYGLHGTRLKQRVEEVLNIIGLSDRPDQRAGTFSGGMKRRLNLGVAIIHEPRLLFLDEPTTGVDPQSRNHIFAQVKNLNANGMTIIYTSHYMEEVQTLCPRIGILDHGKLIACDTLPNLLRSLDGEILFRVAEKGSQLLEPLKSLPGCKVRSEEENSFSLSCSDVPKTLLRVVGMLNERNIELTRLETREPNLERVFLHLTGHALRD